MFQLGCKRRRIGRYRRVFVKSFPSRSPPAFWSDLIGPIGQDIHRFSFLCKHLPPGLEGPVLFHLISKALTVAQHSEHLCFLFVSVSSVLSIEHASCCWMFVSCLVEMKATFSTQVLQEKLQTMICQLFHKHGQDRRCLPIFQTCGMVRAWH
jgi:hypothetical protein